MSGVAEPNWKEKIAQQKWQTKIWDDTKQILKMGRQARSVERLVRKGQDGTLGKLTQDPEEDATEIVNFGEMHIGKPTKKAGGTSTVAKLITGAALAIGGLGAGYLLNKALNPPAATAPGDDTNTQAVYEGSGQ